MQFAAVWRHQIASIAALIANPLKTKRKSLADASTQAVLARPPSKLDAGRGLTVSMRARGKSLQPDWR